MSLREKPVAAHTRLATLMLLWSVIFHVCAHPEGSAGELALRVFLVLMCALGSVWMARGLLLATTTLLGVYWWWELPFVADHVHLQLALLIALIPSWRAERPEPARASGGLLYIAIAMYVFVALAKLNANFFDPIHSCATLLHRYFVEFWGLGDLMHQSAFIPWSVAITEGLVFVLLAIPRTRKLGAILGTCFHLMISSPPNIQVQDYNAALIAAFILAFDDEVIASFDRRFIQRAILPGTIILSLSALLVLADRDAYFLPYIIGYTISYGALYLFVAALVFKQLRRLRLGAAPSVQAASVAKVWWVTKLLVALFVINGLSPYLGLKTLGSFTMFSNLRIAATQNNHWFMPQLGLAQEQRAQVIYPVASEDARLAGLIKDELGVTRFELERIASQRPNAPLSLSAQRAPNALGPAKLGPVEQETLSAAPPSLWQRLKFKLIIYRSIRRSSDQCVI